MATTDLHFVAGGLHPVKRGMRFLGGNVDDQIQIDAAAVAAKAHAAGTISAWIMVPDNSGTYTFFSFGDSSVVEYINFSVEAGTLQLVVCDNTSVILDTNTTSAVIVPHKWHHVCVVQNATAPTFYVDGKKVAQTYTTSTTPGAWGTLLNGLDSGSIGCAEMAGNGTLTQEFKGYISRVKYWKKALTAAEVEMDFNGTAISDDATYLQNSYDLEFDVTDDGLGADDGTIAGDLIYSDANEFASRLTFLETVPLTADNISIGCDGGTGFAYCVLAA